MKNKFLQFSVRKHNDKRELWDNATFVFDSSVLLNFYRYTKETQDLLLVILNTISDRIWIPYHTALVFHRNRLSVIAAQLGTHQKYKNDMFSAKNIFIEKIEEIDIDIKKTRNRYFEISSTSLAQSIERSFKKFIADFKKKGSYLQKPDEYDELLEKIESIFDGKIGDPPKSQQAIDDLYKEADTRFKNKIPPGYEDDGKDKKESDEYQHNEIVYKKNLAITLTGSKFLILQKQKK